MKKCFLIIYLTAISVFGLSAQEFVSAFTSESLPAQAYHEESPWVGYGNEFGVIISDYRLSYKIWSLLGEPVFDFKLKWNGAEHNYLGFKLAIPNWFIEKHEGVNFDFTLDKDLRDEIRLIKPISVEFVFSLYDKTVGKMDVDYLEQKLEEGYSYSLQNYKHFYIDSLARSGVGADFSVPGSPDWDGLHPKYLTMFQKLKSPRDLAIGRVEILSIQWPQYEIEQILLEQINRNNQEQFLRENVAESEDFWDTSATNTERDSVPQARGRISSSRNDVLASSVRRTLEQEQSRGESLAGRTDLFKPSSTGMNTMTIGVDSALGTYTIIGRRHNGEQMWIRENINWASVKLTELSSNFNLEFWKNGIYLGYVPIRGNAVTDNIFKIYGRASSHYYLSLIINGDQYKRIWVGEDDIEIYLPESIGLNDIEISTEGFAVIAQDRVDDKIQHNIEMKRKGKEPAAGTILIGKNYGAAQSFQLKYGEQTYQASMSLISNLNSCDYRAQDTFNDFNNYRLEFQKED